VAAAAIAIDALALYGERGKAVTIRAQVHRVRCYVGACSLDTHPYRLTVPIDGDWLEVRRLVAAGRPRAALMAYRGPLLPASDAPESSKPDRCSTNRCDARS
jgi:hypothetical protein